MNFFGVNSAAVNGTTIAVVLSSVLGVAGATVSAEAFITRPGAATQAIATSVTAVGVRVVPVTATATVASAATAEWSIALDARALIRITAVARASYSDANAVVSSNVTANATHAKAATVSFASTSTSTAAADRKALAEAKAIVGYYTDISTNIQRSGQTTTEREGFVTAATTASVAANATKLLLPQALIASSCTARGTATHGQAAASVVRVYCTYSALGASDTAYASTYSFASASARHLQLVEDARSASTSGATVLSSTVTRPAQAAASSALVVTTDARIAILGRSQWTILSGATAAERLALQGQATVQSWSGGAAEATPTRYSDAFTAAKSTGNVTGTIVQFGQCSYVVTFSPSVDAITNPFTSAPFSRTMRVQSEDRSMRVPYENREMRVA